MKILYTILVVIIIGLGLMISGVITDPTGVIDRVKEIRIDIFESEKEVTNEKS